jgi:hypothetical protein
MDNLKEYLPLLVILLISIVSQALKPKKKQQPATTAPQTDSEEPDVWFEPQPAVAKTPVQQPKIYKPAAVRPKPEKTPAYAKRRENIMPDDEAEAEPFLNAADTEEVKRAIIFSEIFRRPE